MNTTIRKSERVELATTMLRISLGLMFLAHSSILKYFVYALGGTAAYFEPIGLPGWLAYPVFWMEAVGGLLLVVGVGSRWSSDTVAFGARWSGTIHTS